MLVPQQAHDDVVADDVVDVVANTDAEPTPPSPTSTRTYPFHITEHDKIAQALENTKLKQRVRRLDKKNKLKALGGCIQTGGIIAEIDADEDVTLEEVDAKKDVDAQGRLEESQAQVYHIYLEHADKFLSMHDDVAEPAELKEVIEVVTTAKLMTEVVTAAATTITAAPSAARRRKGVVIRDLEETATLLAVILVKCWSFNIPKPCISYLSIPDSESRPPMLNKENYVPWSSRLLWYAKSRANGKLIYNSILNGPYVRRMIPEPGDANREVTVTKTFHLQTDDELSDKELKQIEADDQAIQTILLGLPEDIYAVVDSCEIAQEIWLRVQQMMKGFDIGIQEKKAKLFNEWERFTSNEGESIESYYHPGSESPPPMLNKENYVPWSSCLRYAKSRPNGKLIHNSILNGPYVRRMIPEPDDANREVTVTETFHLQTDDELSEKELKQIEADDQAIQTILLGLPEDIYAAVDSCETAQETWLRERFTSNERESIESYYHRFLMLMNDLKRNKHFPEKIASNLKFLNNLQPEWSRHVTIVHQTKELHTADYTQLYDFLKYNQKENYLQQPMPNPKDITDPTTAMNMALTLMAKAFKLNYSTPTNNNHRISSNPRNRQIAQLGMNMGQDRQMQMVEISSGSIQGRMQGIRLVDLDEIKEINANCILMANLQQASTPSTQTNSAPVYDTDGSTE
nr:hypothetical protein [Tanacetum cinerariifolium]